MCASVNTHCCFVIAIHTHTHIYTYLHTYTHIYISTHTYSDIKWLHYVKVSDILKAYNLESFSIHYRLFKDSSSYFYYEDNMIHLYLHIESAQCYICEGFMIVEWRVVIAWVQFSVSLDKSLYFTNKNPFYYIFKIKHAL